MRPSLRRALVAGVVFTALGVLLTYPVVLRLGVAVPGGGDAWQWVWYLDWFHRALPPGGIPLSPVSDLFHPTGFDLATAYDGVLALSLGVVLFPLLHTLLIVYSVLVLLGLVGSALAMYALAWNRTRRFLPALTAGFVFGFSPTLLARGEGHFNLLYAGVVPLALLATVLLLERRTVRAAVLAGAALALAVAGSFYYGLVAGVGFAVLELHALATDPAQRTRRGAGLLLLTIVTAGALALPIAGPAIGSALTGSAVGPPPGAAVQNSADLVSFVVPAEQSNLHRLLAAGRAGRPRSQLLANPTESANYLGTATLVLSLLAVLGLRNRERWRWTLLLGIGALLALGPELVVLGRRTGIPLPYGTFGAVPGLGLAWAPSRFTVLAHVGTAMLVAFLLARWTPARWGWRPVAAAAGIAALLVIERVALPFPVSPPPFAGPWVQRIRADPGRGAIALLPAGLTLLDKNYEADFLPVATGRPITEGYVPHTARTPNLTVQVDGGPLTALSCHRELTGAGLPPPPDSERFAAELAALGVRYAVVFRTFVQRCAESGARSISLTATWPRLHDDARLIIVQVPVMVP